MSLLLKNQRIYDFYQNNPQFDFEKMNNIMVDLLENFNEKLNPAFDQSFASRLMEQMGNVQKQLVTQQSDNQLEYYKQLGVIRTQYLDDLKTMIQPMLVQNMDQLYDKISNIQKDESPMINAVLDKVKQEMVVITNSFSTVNQSSIMSHDQLLKPLEDKLSYNFTSFQTITNQMLSSTESRLRDDLRSQQYKLEEMNKIGQKQEMMNNQVSELLRKMDNSSSKGKISETMLSHVLNNLYPMADVQAVGTTKETGDFMMKRENKPDILFENKNYDKNVGQDEVQKFLRDVETQQCAGVMMAQNYGIANKSNYEIHLYQGNVCVYLHQVQYNPEKIKIAIDIIDHLSQFIDISGFKTEAITIDKEFLDQINKEYQSFVQQKLNQIKTIKEYSSKMLMQIDEMKMPQIEQWLSKYFSHSFSKEHLCKYCGFESKSAGGLTSHLRSCVAKKKIDDGSTTVNMNTFNAPSKPSKPANVNDISVYMKPNINNDESKSV
jgi:hypothetical protein